MRKELNMDLREYFENTKGFGVLATSDSEGRVDAAVYARPHFMDNGTIALIMRDRLTHHNLQSNSHAAFLFREDGPGYKGKVVLDQGGRRGEYRTAAVFAHPAIY